MAKKVPAGAAKVVSGSQRRYAIMARSTRFARSCTVSSDNCAFPCPRDQGTATPIDYVLSVGKGNAAAAAAAAGSSSGQSSGARTLPTFQYVFEHSVPILEPPLGTQNVTPDYLIRLHDAFCQG